MVRSKHIPALALWHFGSSILFLVIAVAPWSSMVQAWVIVTTTTTSVSPSIQMYHARVQQQPSSAIRKWNLHTTRLNAVNASATAELSEAPPSTTKSFFDEVAVNGDAAGWNKSNNDKVPPPHWAHPRRKFRDETASITSHPPSSPSSSSSSISTTLGDIMSDSSSVLLVTGGSGCASSTSTTSSSSLAATYGITHPLDRIALTANGNLQRLVSSYYDAPVSVVVDSCEKRQTPNNTSPANTCSTETTTSVSTTTFSSSSSSSLQPQIWDRVVHLTIYNQTFCTATSEIVVHDAVCQQLVESGQVGLGQLFRYLDLLPTFWLHHAAPKEHGGFWRDYTLQCPELSCRIHEDFVPGMWELQPPPDMQP